MLKELVLMRHAHAAAPMGWQADAERPLSPTGRAEAFAAGTWLRDTCEPPDAVLCSPAVRTRETLARHYLCHTDFTVGDIAFLLGYQETNSFLRAFVLWTGEAPAACRRRGRNA